MEGLWFWFGNVVGFIYGMPANYGEEGTIEWGGSVTSIADEGTEGFW